MSEPDDVERLVAEALDRNHCEGEDYFRCHLCGHVADGPAEWVQLVADSHNCKTLRLARIVRELLAEHVAGPCINGNIRLSCSSVWPKTQQLWCEPCFDRALRERLNKIARGEKA